MAVGELRAVVHSNALKDMAEVRPALKVIQNSYDRSRVLARDFEYQLHARHALHHDNDGLTLSLLFAYDAVHLPVAEGRTVGDDLWPVLYTGAMNRRFSGDSPFPWVLSDTVFREIRGARIQQAAPKIAIDGILAEIAKIGITQRR